jgi:uncharacterized protein
MSDIREQLLKAGLVSAKQVRQAKHQERVHRKEVGQEGLEAEKASREKAILAEEEERRRQDRELEEARMARLAEDEAARALTGSIQAGWIRDATGGNRRFYFVTEGVRITYLDLNDQAVRRLLSGSAAIVVTLGAARGEFCVVDGTTAAGLARDHAEVLRYWNRASTR